jgi:protein involved in polysaccharide export with SLBB domain
MNKMKLNMYGVIISFLLNGCSQILEPISFYGDLDQDSKNKQEEFSINIQPLTFSSAKKANNDPYVRKLMQTGSGLKANVFDENDFLKTTLPPFKEKPEYVIGIGDELSFILLNEFLNIDPSWPKPSPPSEYLLGVGDELTFIQQFVVEKQDDFIGLNKPAADEFKSSLLETDGVIGSDGNILLLSIGNINAANRSLSDVRSDVRNILIREGIAPNFQLDISKFKSKKAYITTSEDIKNSSQYEGGIININNIPQTLGDVVLSAGISQHSKNSSIIKLTRNSKEYKITSRQLLNPATPKIYIQDGDNIYIKSTGNQTSINQSVVDSEGSILLANIGKIEAEGKTLAELRFKIARKLLANDLKPNFQLEFSKFESKNVQIVKNGSSVEVPITDKNLTIRQIIQNSEILPSSNSELTSITLVRDNKKFQMTTEEVLNSKNQNIWVQNKDQIEINVLKYKTGQVFALGGHGNATIVPIEPSKRETLADVLFVPAGVLNNQLAQRSEVYLIRGRDPSKAYHLDAQNVSSLLVAAQTELRPNDIIFVAERPIISFARTLGEINPLRNLLRDIQNNNIP